jgi:two-component system, LytTR family, response regulator
MILPSKIRVVVVDDEAPARRKISRLLRDEDGVEVVAEADSGESALAAVTKYTPDLVFLDVQMPGMDGFGVAETIAKDGELNGKNVAPRILFVTAHDQYALRAFEVHAFDYLLKPVSEERFREALRRVRAQLGERSRTGDTEATRLRELLDQLRREKSYADRLLIQESERAFFLPVAEILWVESERNYLLLHCGKKTHTMRGTLEALENSLDPKVFVRINRGNLVRLSAIRELLPWFHGEFKVILQDSAELRWSRRYVAQRPELLKLK